MTDKESITLTKDQFADLMDRVAALANPRMNPLEQRKLNEEIEREKRRDQVQIESAKTETLKAKARKDGCSHCRWPASSGKKAGHAAPRGTGEWVTQAQFHEQNGTIDLMCQRCQWIWRWKATPEEVSFLKDNDGGMAGFPPPAEEKLIYQG